MIIFITNILLLLLLSIVIISSKNPEEIKKERLCVPLPQYRNIEVWCLNKRNEEARATCFKGQPTGTIAKYKCKSSHIPIDGSDKDSHVAQIENELKCDKNGEWIGIKRYETYRCKEDCGKLTKNSKPLVINGVQSNRTQYPWHATIFRKNGNNWSYKCGGSIIRNQVVLTAAHCFAIDHNSIADPGEYRILLGTISSEYNENLNQEGIQIHKVQRIQVSENYDPKNGHQADIAVVQLKDNIEYNENVVPVCLPNDYNTDVNAVKAGMVGQVAGFGITEDGKISNGLRSLDLRVKSNSECYSSLQRVLSESQFCGGEKLGTSRWETVCNGDSGGGLSFASSVHQKYFIHGIVSSGDPNTENGVCKNYAVFTRIYPFLFWIRDVVEEITGEIARDLRQNTPYPYALRGTETQLAVFAGLPREWINRVTSLEVVYAKFISDVMLEALENAQPIVSINLENVVLTNGHLFRRHVVLPLISSFSLDLIPENDPKFDRISSQREYPLIISESYLKSLLFFDKDFETGENWKAESLINLNTDIDLTISIFKIMKLNIKNGELSLQQIGIADRILDGVKSNSDFIMKKLALHKVNVDAFEIGKFHSLTELVLDNITLNFDHIGQAQHSSEGILRNLENIKVLVLNPIIRNRKFKLSLDDISQTIEHISLSESVEIKFATALPEFPNLRTFCCIDCELSEEIRINIHRIFPNLATIVMKNNEAFKNHINFSSLPNLEWFYTEYGSSNQHSNTFMEKDKSNHWNSLVLSSVEQKHIFYECNRQYHFWISEEEYTILSRLKTFEKEAVLTNKYLFRGISTGQNIEKFEGIPSQLQTNLETITLEAADVTTHVLAQSVENTKSLKLMTLKNIIIDISSVKYSRIKNHTVELRLEEIPFNEFKFQYVLEYIDGTLKAATIPFQRIGRFKDTNSTNVLHRLFTTINSVRIQKDNSTYAIYVLDSTVLEIITFKLFSLKVIQTLPLSHPLQSMSGGLVESHAKYVEDILPHYWKLNGLHVIGEDLVNWFLSDDVLKILSRLRLTDTIFQRLGKLITIERSTSLSLQHKERNPLNFPLIHAVAASLNEDKIE